MHISAVCCHLFHGSRPEPSDFEGSALNLPGDDPASALTVLTKTPSGLLPVPVLGPHLALP